MNAKLAHPRYWLTWLVLGFGWLLAQLPYVVQRWLGNRLGDLFCLLRLKRLRIAERNIDACFPELTEIQRSRLVKEHMRALGLGLFEMLICWFGRKAAIVNRFEFVGEEHLTKYTDQGVLLLSLHFTNLEICAPILGTRIPLIGIQRTHDNPIIEYLQSRGRIRYHPASGPHELMDRDDVRGMVKALRQKKTMLTFPDQDLGERRSVFAPFFGVQTATSIAPFKLAAAGRAKVLPVLFTRPSPSTYRIEIFPALENYPTGDDVADATRFNKLAEDFILDGPERYLWVHRRFKTRPKGEPSLYKDL